MSDNFIGTTRLKEGYTKKNYFYLKSEFDKGGVVGGQNIFRVLPPLFSLATEGKYYQYYSVHKFATNTQGKMRPFVCIEDKDYKTKMIRQHCPVCDYLTEKTQQMDMAKQKGVSDQQIRDFNEVYIKPYQPERRYYLNVIDQSGQIGILGVPSKAFKALESLVKEYMQSNIDITGMRGLFLNFVKDSKYKGDNQVMYKVEVHREKINDPQQGLIERPKAHDLTPDLINRIKKEASDLSKLFARLTPEEVGLILRANGDERRAVVDRVFSKGSSTEEEGSEEESSGLITAKIGGTDMSAVVSMSVSSQGVTVTAPNLGILNANEPVTDSFVGFSMPAGKSEPKASTTAGSDFSNMSDAQFQALFADLNKTK